jgi:hypothetical protein
MNFYYKAPKDKYFDEVKKEAMKLWKKVDSDNDKFGYATGKINRIKDIKNIDDNFMYMVAMFDINNQRLLANNLSDGAKKAIRDRMIAGGATPLFIVF